jgi:hypothetical protein
MRPAPLAALWLALAGCASLAPSVRGVWISPDAPTAPPSGAPPALVLIGDVGMPLGDETLRLVRAIARQLEPAPGAPVLVLGDVFYSTGLLGACGDRTVSRSSCDRPGRPEDQFEAVLGPYRDLLPGHPVIGIGGNHDFYGGPEATANACRLMPGGGPGWRYLARGCGLDDPRPVARLDLGALAVLVLDSEPMLRDRTFRERALAALRAELELLRRERPAAAVLVAAHHPLETHGAHNGAGLAEALAKDLDPLLSTLLLPLTWPLERVIGAQDPYDRRYRAYRRGLYRVFRELPISAFAAGHDHSLQHVGIEHPGVRHQLVSGAGADRTRVKRLGLDLWFSGRLARALGLRDAIPAPRHRLLFGLGGEQAAPDLTGWGFATLAPTDAGLQVQFFDPAREAPIYSARLATLPAAGASAPR